MTDPVGGTDAEACGSATPSGDSGQEATRNTSALGFIEGHGSSWVSWAWRGYYANRLGKELKRLARLGTMWASMEGGGARLGL